MNQHYDVFISYRRDGGEYLALNLYERLKDRGFSVFRDVESLRSGNFNTSLYDVLAFCNDVIILLSPNGLDRCVNENDWVRKEIAYAIETGKNIIPIFMPGFEWPDFLPPDINEVRYMNGLTSTTVYFDEFIEKLMEFLVSSSEIERKAPNGHSFRAILLFLIYTIGLMYPVLHFFMPNLPYGLLPRIIYFLWILIGAAWIWNRIETCPDFAAKCFGTIHEEELSLHPQELYSRIVGTFGTKTLISTDIPVGFTCFYRLKRLEFGSWDGKKTNYLCLIFRRTLEYYDPSVLYLHCLSRGRQAIKMLTRQGFIVQTKPEIINIPNVECLTKKQMNVFLYYNRRKLDHVVIYNCRVEEIRNHLLRLEEG